MLFFCLLLLYNFPVFAKGESGAAPLAVKVLILTTFAKPIPAEATPWLQNQKLSRKIIIPGLYDKAIYCRPNGNLCMAVIGMGKANAAASMMALGLSTKLNLSQTYIILSGIAGGDPNKLSLGSVAIVQWVIDGDLANHIPPTELPESWTFPYFRLGCASLWCETTFATKTEAFKLDDKLINWAYMQAEDITLANSNDLEPIRKEYNNLAGSTAPTVIQCDSLAADTYWLGTLLSNWANWWVKQWSQQQGNFCVSAMEGTGFLTAIERLSEFNRVEMTRILIVRAISDYVSTASNTDPLNLAPKEPGKAIAIENAYRVSLEIAKKLIQAH